MIEFRCDEEEFTSIIKEDYLLDKLDWLRHELPEVKVLFRDIKIYEINNCTETVKVLVEYDGDISESTFHDFLNDKDWTSYLFGYEIYYNPIRPDKSGTIEEYMNHLARVYYD